MASPGFDPYPEFHRPVGNDAFESAQDQYAGPGWAQFFSSLQGKRVNLNGVGDQPDPSAALPSPAIAGLTTAARGNPRIQ